MKKSLKIAFIILVGLFVSCSSDEDQFELSTDDIIGVWEQQGFLDTSGQRLIFALNLFEYTSNQDVCIISRTVYSEDEIVSGIVCYSWEINNNEVVVFEEDSEVVGIYTLNSEGQLISADSQEVPFDKISDSIDGYL